MLIHRDRERESAVIGPHHLLEEPFRRGNVTFRGEHKLDCVTFFIEGSVQVLPLLPDFDLGLIYSVRSAGELEVRAHPFVDLRRVPLDPPKHG